MAFGPDRINTDSLKLKAVLIQELPDDNRTGGMIEKIRGDSVTIRRVGKEQGFLKVGSELIEQGFTERGGTRVFMLPLAALPEQVRSLLATPKNPT